MSQDIADDALLILAAEECPSEQFSTLHWFSKGDARTILRLIAHGPVLLRGGRGSGKSALMIEATRRLAPHTADFPAFGIYLSLRHLELIRGKAEAYERFLCELIISETNNKLAALDIPVTSHLNGRATVSSLRRDLADLARRLGKRIVLLFDDAAHIGRETSLGEFFDIFRTISSDAVSCKAAIYPGVTQFGTRFDMFNDATVVEVVRREEWRGFAGLWEEIMQARYPQYLAPTVFGSRLPRSRVASFLGQAVLGNMRAFVFACNTLVERKGESTVGLTHLGDTLLDLSRNYYWPLLEELAPKLGVYQPMVTPATTIAETLFERCGKENGRRAVLVFRNIMERLAKPFEMLEYAGFISKREVSRAMKSGGRGVRYDVNLCNLLERVSGTRLTEGQFETWFRERQEPLEFHRGSTLNEVVLPELDEESELEILTKPVRVLTKSRAYPYGLTEAKIEVLEQAEIQTVGDLAAASDERLLNLYYVGPATVERFRNIVGQAVWM